MTHPTKAIYRLLLADFVRVTSMSSEDTLYTDQDIEDTMSRIETINYHQVVTLPGGIRFWCYNAGHVLGAAMFMIEIAGVKLLYTGDYSRSEDRHLMSAELPEVSPDVLVIESTYGISNQEPAALRERMFTEAVRNIVRRRGRCLIPQFALGRAQELLLILEEFWEANPSLQSVPIYYASSLAKKCLAVYQTFINMMNTRIQEQAQVKNPFVFKHIQNLRNMSDFDDSGPCVILASPGMLQHGLSRELFEKWCSDRRNGVVMTGYCVENTLGHTILSSPPYITSLNGMRLELNMSVHSMMFSAHADYRETSEFIDALRPPHVILVHGERREMMRLKHALEETYLPTDVNILVSAPANCQTVSIEFRAKRIVRVLGTLAEVAPRPGAPLAGILVRRDFTYSMMTVDDLPKYTPLAVSTVKQKLVVPFTQSFDAVRVVISQMYEITDIEESQSEPQGEGESTKPSKLPSITIHDGVITISQSPLSQADLAAAAAADAIAKDTTRDLAERERAARLALIKSRPSSLTIEWDSDPVADSVVDSVIALLMSVEANPGAAKFLGGSCCDHDHGHEHEHEHDHHKKQKEGEQVTDTTEEASEENTKESQAVAVSLLRASGETSRDYLSHKPTLSAAAESARMKAKQLEITDDMDGVHELHKRPAESEAITTAMYGNVPLDRSAIVLGPFTEDGRLRPTTIPKRWTTEKLDTLVWILEQSFGNVFTLDPYVKPNARIRFCIDGIAGSIDLKTMRVQCSPAHIAERNAIAAATATPPLSAKDVPVETPPTLTLTPTAEPPVLTLESADFTTIFDPQSGKSLDEILETEASSSPDPKKDDSSAAASVLGGPMRGFKGYSEENKSVISELELTMERLIERVYSTIFPLRARPINERQRGEEEVAASAARKRDALAKTVTSGAPGAEDVYGEEEGQVEQDQDQDQGVDSDAVSVGSAYSDASVGGPLVDDEI